MHFFYFEAEISQKNRYLTYKISFTENNIHKILNKLNEHVSSRLDTWNANFLKLCNGYMVILLKILWGAFLETGLILRSLKNALYRRNIKEKTDASHQTNPKCLCHLINQSALKTNKETAHNIFIRNLY